MRKRRVTTDAGTPSSGPARQQRSASSTSLIPNPVERTQAAGIEQAVPAARAMHAPGTGPTSTYEEGDELSHTIDSVLAATVLPRGDRRGRRRQHRRQGRAIMAHVRKRRAPGGPWHRRCRNRGAAVSTEPNVVFLDAHCTVQGGWLEPMLDVLKRDPNALVGSAMRDARDPRFIGVRGQLVNALARLE